MVYKLDTCNTWFFYSGYVITKSLYGACILTNTVILQMVWWKLDLQEEVLVLLGRKLEPLVIFCVKNWNSKYSDNEKFLVKEYVRLVEQVVSLGVFITIIVISIGFWMKKKL